VARRILLADDPGPVVDAVARDLEERGCAVDAVSPHEAAERAMSRRYDAALVRGTRKAVGVVPAMRAADPFLPVLVLFLDRKEARARGAVAEGADGVLVGPLTASSVGTLAAFASKLRDSAEKIAEVEAALAARRQPGAHDLAFLKRLLLVEVRRSRRYAYPLSLALLEVDGWRNLSAQLPAAARTALLADVLRLVTASLRDIDLAVPLTAERLVVLLPHTRAEGGLRVAKRLCAKLRERGGSPALTASVGVASHGGDGTVSFGSLVKRAGEALARARGAGGDRAEAADPVKKRDRISIG
jgi:diguanylate cyclase (GGDEF)-like protein